MKADTYPLQVLLLTLAGWVNRHQQRVIEYLSEENRDLREQLGGKVPRLTDDQRRRLAAKGKILDRCALEQVATIVTPGKIMLWHKRLIAAKWTYAQGRVGRLGIMKEIRELVVRFAEENLNWVRIASTRPPSFVTPCARGGVIVILWDPPGGPSP